MNKVYGLFKGAQNQGKTGFDSVNGEPLQVRWNWKIRIILNAYIPISMEFSQT
jgi:hypothetical protein